MRQISSVPHLGTVSADVVVLQDALRAAGENPGPSDGIYGGKVEAAIISLQRKNGLGSSGTVGPRTLKLLSITVVPTSPVTGKSAATKDLKGRQDRHLHPTFRLMLEDAILMSDKSLPPELLGRDPQVAYAFVMRRMGTMGIHEVGANNHGTNVGYIQSVVGAYTANGNGDPWCLDWAQCGIAFVEDVWQIESPIMATAHCMTCLNAAKKVPGLVSTTPEVGTLGLGRHGNTSDGHAMPVIRIVNLNEVETSEGNTSDENMRDGDGAVIKIRNAFQNGNLHTEGWVRLWPHNEVP